MFKEPICPCGSRGCHNPACEQDVNGNWTTTLERLSRPRIELAPIQQAVYVLDSSVTICDICGSYIDSKLIEEVRKNEALEAEILSESERIIKHESDYKEFKDYQKNLRLKQSAPKTF